MLAVAQAPGAGSHRRQRRGGGGRNQDKKPPGCVVDCGLDGHADAQRLAKQPQQQSRALQNNRAINRQVINAADAGDLSALLQIVQHRLKDMNGINLATSLHRIAKLASGHGQGDSGAHQDVCLEQLRKSFVVQNLIDAIRAHVRNHSLMKNSDGTVAANEMPAQCVSIVAWSCATLRIHCEPLLTDIAELVAPRLAELKPFELSNLLWAYAKLQANPGELSKAVATRMLNRKDGEFKVQCLSTVAWAFTTMRQRHAPLFASLAQELAARASQMKPQELSNTLWAYAKTQALGGRSVFHHTALFNAVGRVILQDSYVWQFKAQELSNTVWAFATVGLHYPKLFKAVEDVVIAMRWELAPQHVANILWAFARLQVESHSLFSQLLDVAASRSMQTFKPEELTALVSAASEMCPDSLDFFAQASCVCARRVAEFTPNALANLAAAFASLRRSDESQVLEAIILEGIRRLNQLETVALSKLFGATVEASGRLPPSLPQQLAEHVVRTLSSGPSLAEGTPRAIHRLTPAAAQEVASALQTSGPAACAAALEKAITRVCPDRDRRRGQAGASVHANSAASDDEDYKFEAHLVVRGSQKENQAMSTIESGSTSVGSQSEDEDNRCHVLSDQDVSSQSGSSLQGLGATLLAAASATGTAPPGLARPAFGSPALENPYPAEEPWRVPLPAGFSTSAMDTRLQRPAKVTDVLSLDLSRPSDDQAGDSFDVLRVVDGSCLTEVVNGQHQALDMARLLDGLERAERDIKAHIVFLRQGMLNERVTLRRMPVEACPTISLTLAGPGGCQHALRPLARVLDAMACTKGFAVLAYPHCAHGTLSEWVTERVEARCPVTSAEAARVVHSVFLAAVALIEASGPEALTAVQADEVFIGAGEVALLREPLIGSVNGWHDDLKWLSPEEAVGSVVHGSRASSASEGLSAVNSAWPSLAYRLGLLLYCLGSCDSNGGCRLDPFPQLRGEDVLLGLLQEARGTGSPVRPDISRWQGPGILKQLLAALLRVADQQPPAMEVAATVLETVARQVAPTSSSTSLVNKFHFALAHVR